MTTTITQIPTKYHPGERIEWISYTGSMEPWKAGTVVRQLDDLFQTVKEGWKIEVQPEGTEDQWGYRIVLDTRVALIVKGEGV